MLISGGKVIAIDKVKHDDTLTGDGKFIPLGVRDGAFLTGGDWATITGNYNNDFSYDKKEGPLNFKNGAVLSADSVYQVTTEIAFKPSAMTPYWYDMSLKVGGQTHKFSVDGMNNGIQNFSFTQMEDCKTKKTLKITPTFDNGIGSAFINQSIHNIIGIIYREDGPEPTPVETLEMTLSNGDGQNTTYNIMVLDPNEIDNNANNQTNQDNTEEGN